MSAEAHENLDPLCVDMDGTLLRTDSLDECFWTAVSDRPGLLLKVPLWLAQGRARLKAQLAPYGLPNVETWPIRQVVLDLIDKEKSAGRPVWLVTAADEKLAQAVAARLGIFDGVLASDGELNLKGSAKAQMLVERFGEKQFWYVGDSGDDIEVWKHASRGFRVRSEAKKNGVGNGNVEALVFRGAGLSGWLRQLRLHQWIKNTLLAVPMLAAHAFLDPLIWVNVIMGALLLSMVASGTYVVNDCLDLDADRRVPSKSNRPLARGDLPLRKVFVVGTGIFLAGFAGAFLLDPTFGVLVFVYAFASLSYSSFLRRLLFIDVLMLSGFYVWRLVMGAQLAGVPLSPWFLGFALFFFVSVALAKRYAELWMENEEGVSSHLRRPYDGADLPVIMAFGIGSSLITVLVLALYINSDQSQQLYAHPSILWLMCPVLLYWLARVWFKAHRGEMSVDPVLYAIRDRSSYIVLALLILIPLFAAF